MEQAGIFTSVLMFLLAAVVLVPLGKRFGIGPILSYLAAGVLLGPGGIAVVSEPAAVLHFAELGDPHAVCDGAGVNPGQTLGASQCHIWPR